MAKKHEDLTGNRYGRNLVMSFAGNAKNGDKYWNVKCDCGTERVVSGSTLKSGRSNSCGCLMREEASKRFTRDLTGQRFGMLVVEERAGSAETGCALWKCRCDCGKEKIIRGPLLIKGEAVSCGCYALAQRKLPKSHGLSDHPLYSIWADIKQRCFNKNNNNYKNYGGRGISVCKEWSDSFESFYEWAEADYKKGLSIDRIDVNGDYCPENCRWADRTIQSRNKRNTRHITINGITRSLYDWCDHYNCPYGRAETRLKHGWPVEDLFGEKDYRWARKNKNVGVKVIYNGKPTNLFELCLEIGFDYSLAQNRRRLDWPDEFLFKPKGFSYKRYLKEQQKKQQEANAS